MISSMARYFAGFLMIFATAQPLLSANESAVKLKEFLYVLHLVPRLHDEKAWTKDDTAAVESHFTRLQQATARGQVIFVGRTAESDDKTFGLVVFAAADENAALEFMNSDPAVIAGVMTAELHPFSVILQHNNS
jgi:uncharacterized protein YciI